MKRFITILFLIGSLSLTASAQWYLYPGNKNKQKEKFEQVSPKTTEAPADHIPAVQPAEQTALPDTLPVSRPDTLTGIADDFILDIPETINVTLLLPLKSSAKPSSNFFEYYTGAMLAAADLCRSGLKININVYDTESSSATPAVLEASDVIIGPVSSSAIKAMIPKLPESKYIISPLEPKAIALADSSRVIQAPSSLEAQMDELVSWIAEEKRFSDRLIVITEEDETKLGASAKYLLNKLRESGIEHTISRTSTVNDIQLGKTTRFIVASDDDKYLCTSVNNIGNLALRNPGIILYAQSKLRTNDAIHSESLYRANARLAANYYVDYTSAEVKDFIRRFRAAFGTEPSSFAFSGYDTLHYFVSIVATYGRNWHKTIPEYSERGLQADFKFERKETVGNVNCAVRRVVFNPNLSATLK